MSNTDQRSLTSGTDHINTLPDECLAEIFAHAGTPVPQHEHPYRVIILGSVCSRWRAVTLDWPALWSKIYIPVNVVVKGSAINRPRYEGSAEDERWTSKLRDAVELYLTRSKTLGSPLYPVGDQTPDDTNKIHRAGIKDFATVKSVELATHKPGECLLRFPKVKMVTLLAQGAHLPVTGRVFRSNFVSSLTVVATWDTIATIQEMLYKVEFPNLKIIETRSPRLPGTPASLVLHTQAAGFAIRSQDLLDILGMAHLTSLSIDDSSYPLVGPYRPISNALLVALADPKIVPDLERLHLYWRHDVDIDGSLVARLLETRGNRLADVVTPKRRATV
ncbi:uncharacterized protein ARMOST_06554 [Armillaria ostoyae]|uniref:F-box domain-containing protein n=1 Tax=Armillaria ostoyae TaxID=47428 RepID=A0A284R3C3_ARMOS|nr:uncharacterized protein ARMOST_06554 [Armillaria ostoyae]